MQQQNGGLGQNPGHRGMIPQQQQLQYQEHHMAHPQHHIARQHMQHDPQQLQQQQQPHTYHQMPQQQPHGMQPRQAQPMGQQMGAMPPQQQQQPGPPGPSNMPTTQQLMPLLNAPQVQAVVNQIIQKLMVQGVSGELAKQAAIQQVVQLALKGSFGPMGQSFAANLMAQHQSGVQRTTNPGMVQGGGMSSQPAPQQRLGGLQMPGPVAGAIGPGFGNVRPGLHQPHMPSLTQQFAEETRGRYAKRDAELPTDRRRNPRKQQRSESPEPRYSGEGMLATRESKRQTTRRINYAEDGYEDLDSSDNEEEERAKKEKREAVAAFNNVEEFDDEIEKVLDWRDMEDVKPHPDESVWDFREFLIKWRRWSYVHCSWDTLTTLGQLAGYKRVLNFIKRQDEQLRQRAHMTREEIELQDVEKGMEQQLWEQHKQVERVVAERVNPGDNATQYLIKWSGLPYSETTWERKDLVMQLPSGPEEVKMLLEREDRACVSSHNVDVQRRAFLAGGHRALTQQPPYLKWGKLRDYQLDGLNFLIYCWLQDNNAILADEMGLGKTIQCVSMISFLTESMSILGPFLIVVPLSTVPNWIREFRRWAPQVNALVYVGDTKSREVIRSFEFHSARRPQRQFKFEVMITTYELSLKDADILREVKWNYLVVDEAHRLKNAESALYKELFGWSFRTKLLITGTPLQNSMKELWALLHFLEPYKFPDCETFELHHNVNNEASVTRLHQELRPHLLRRVIKNVEKSLPPKNERILRVQMTPLQRQYYKWVLTRNFTQLNKGTKGHVSLLNIISELKKACNHPFLFEAAEEQYRSKEGEVSGAEAAMERLILTSGKMVLLDKLLRRLKSTGHRVLIFSQMVRMLDIISDYMRARGYQHQRLDGSTPPVARHQAMEHFNAESSTDFAFLLSTRAGGLGINLATADTVIIFDSDWNPQNDLQAMSRAHRIGQKDTVNIYRFVTSSSVEEDILERAKRKMVLDHVVIQRMDTSGRTVLDPRGSGAQAAKQMFGKLAAYSAACAGHGEELQEELAQILRFGAEDLFKEDEETERKDKKLYEEDIDAILERAELVDTSHSNRDDATNELFSQFNVATFKTDEDDATFWNRLISQDPKEEGPHGDDEPMPRGGRYKIPEATKGGRKDRREERRKKRNEKKPVAIASGPNDPGPPLKDAILRIDEWPPDCDEHGDALPTDGDDDFNRPSTLGRRDAHIFMRGVRRYGLISRLGSICEDVGSVVAEAPRAAQLALWFALIRGLNDSVEKAENECVDPKEVVLDWFGNAIKAKEMLDHLEQMRVLASLLEQLPDIYSFRLDESMLPPAPKWREACSWTPEDDAMALVGTYLYGLCHWEKMAADPNLRLIDKLSGAVKDGPNQGDKSFPQASHLETRILGVLRKIDKASRSDGGRKARDRRKKDGVGVQLGQKRPRASSGKYGGAGGSGPAKRGHQEAPGPFEHAGGAARPAAMVGRGDDQRCKELLEPVMMEVKKLRLVQTQEGLSEAKALVKTKKYLRTIGAHVETLPTNQSATLWNYISDYTSNPMDGQELYILYCKYKDQPGAGAAALTVADASGNGAAKLEATEGDGGGGGGAQAVAGTGLSGHVQQPAAAGRQYYSEDEAWDDEDDGDDGGDDADDGDWDGDG